MNFDEDIGEKVLEAFRTKGWDLFCVEDIDVEGDFIEYAEIEINSPDNDTMNPGTYYVLFPLLKGNDFSQVDELTEQLGDSGAFPPCLVVQGDRYQVFGVKLNGDHLEIGHRLVRSPETGFMNSEKIGIGYELLDEVLPTLTPAFPETAN